MFVPFQGSFCFNHLTEKKRRKNPLCLLCYDKLSGHTHVTPRSIRCNASVSQLKHIPLHEVNYKNWRTLRGRKFVVIFDHFKRNYPLAEFCLPNQLLTSLLKVRLNCWHRARVQSQVSKQLASMFVFNNCWLRTRS